MLQAGFSKAEHYNLDALYQRKIYHCYGDPSLRLFTTSPKVVDCATVTRNENSLDVKCDKPMYISVYNLIDKTTTLVYGTHYIKYYPKDLEGNVYGNPYALTVSVYNNNYKPKIYYGIISLDPRPIFSPVLNSCEVTSDQSLCAEYDSLNAVNSAQIIVTDIYGNRKIIHDCDLDSEETTFSISSLDKGVYVVSLVVDGQITGSKRIIK